MARKKARHLQKSMKLSYYEGTGDNLGALLHVGPYLLRQESSVMHLFCIRH
jgi:hypothetical protein